MNNTYFLKKEAIPANVERALRVLDEMARMVQTVVQSAGLRSEHWEWLSKIRHLNKSPQHRAALALALVFGPMEKPADGKPDVNLERRRVFSCALLEAALFEQEHDTDNCCFDPHKLERTLLDWLKLGSWRPGQKPPLTEIGRVVEQVSKTPDDAVATRLGLLVPFWSSLTLWRLHAGS